MFHQKLLIQFYPVSPMHVSEFVLLIVKAYFTFTVTKEEAVHKGKHLKLEMENWMML